MNRRQFVGLSGGAVMGSILHAGASTNAPAEAVDEAGQAASGASMKRPNLILFMPDEMRADSLACYGNSVTKTPNFDKLAAGGSLFKNCHVQFPVCGASRCSMLTGWPTSVRGHRSLYYFLRPEEPNLFRYLREAGYEVFWFGKNDALAAQSFASSVTYWEQGTEGRSPGATRPTDLTPGSLSMLYGPAGDRRQTSDYRLLSEAMRILERKESTKPFCIFLPLIQPHPPYTIPEDFYHMYNPSSLPALVPPGLQKKPDFHEGIRERYGLKKLSDTEFRKIRAVYYGQVSYSDWLLGELLEKLESSGRSKDTALFVMSDHGDYTGDYGLVEKWPSGLEDCLTHIPLIARVPGAKQGVVSDGMVELYDIMQTCIDLAGTQTNHTHFSRSMLPVIEGGAADKERAAFAEGGYNVYEPQCFEPGGAGGGPYAGKIGLQNEQPVMVSRSAMIRTQTHKLILRPQGQSELYSYRDDPREERNLYGDRGSLAVEAELTMKLLKQFINTTGIAPMDKDPRDSPPFYPRRTDLPAAGWQARILD